MENKLKYRKVLKTQFQTGKITKKEYKKELKWILCVTKKPTK